MSDAQNNQDNVPSDAEEDKQDAKALEERTENQVRAEVVEKFGLNEEAQGDLIDNLVSHELEQRKTLGKAIQQKRSYREELKKAKKPTGGEEPKGGDGNKPTDKGPEESTNDNPKQSSLAEQAKVFQAVKDFDTKQLEYVEMISNTKGISIPEAKESEDFKLWNESYIKKVEEQNTTPNPSSGNPSNDNSDLEGMSVKDILALPPGDKRREEWVKNH